MPNVIHATYLAFKERDSEADEWVNDFTVLRAYTLSLLETLPHS